MCVKSAVTSCKNCRWRHSRSERYSGR